MDEDVARWTNEIHDCEECLRKDAQQIIEFAAKYVGYLLTNMVRSELFHYQDSVASFDNERFFDLRYSLDSIELKRSVQSEFASARWWPHLRSDLDKLDRAGYAQAIDNFETALDLEIRYMIGPIGEALAAAGIEDSTRWIHDSRGYRFIAPLVPMPALRSAIDMYVQSFYCRFRLLGELRAAQSRANRRVVEERLSA